MNSVTEMTAAGVDTADNLPMRDALAMMHGASVAALFRHHFDEAGAYAPSAPLARRHWAHVNADLYGGAWHPVLSLGGLAGLLDPLPAVQRAQVEDSLREALQGGQRDWQVDFASTDDLDARWFRIGAVIERHACGRPDFVQGALRDVTSQRRVEQELQDLREQMQHMARHDTLTGLPNRALCAELLHRTVDAGRRYGRKFALFMIDLDRFKIVNDTLGHDAGDLLLQEMARRYRSVLRASELIARMGGDEFLVLAEEVADEDGATAIAQKLLAATLAPVQLPGHECRVTASVGICLYPRDGADEQTLMKNADIAMYLAKENGKNTFHFPDPQAKGLGIERLVLESQLRRAIERDELSLHYQPKIEYGSGRIRGVEALLRWQHPELGSVPPLRFIPVAEEIGLIATLGRWVIHTACQQAMAWQRAGLPALPVAVNVSALQFANDDLYDDIVDSLARSGLPPELLEIELTESMVMQDVDRAVRLLTLIKSLGVRVAIDDFGTGYSSLAQIRRFPVDTLKVDRSFVRNIQDDRGGQAITEAIIAMARTLSLTVVAEGVETPAEAQFLHGRSCDQMQGYYFSRPLDAAGFARLLEQASQAEA
jgi:diguanylate cyclase (GGDEF)-like protein